MQERASDPEVRPGGKGSNTHLVVLLGQVHDLAYYVMLLFINVSCFSGQLFLVKMKGSRSIYIYIFF